ncbi:SanA/YdcF family protein [Endozoicomonadaceae bacterium StTr2]
MTGLLVYESNRLISTKTEVYLYDSLGKLPYRKVGLIPGTSRYTSQGNQNAHYYLRLNTAVMLYKAGKVSYLLVSGDNATRYYDEPTRMRADLMARGIPASNIYRDYAGFRTLDSVIRANRVFGLEQFTIISQPYQNERAIYIARENDIEAIGFNAGTGFPADWRNRLREHLARVLAVIDVNLINTQPRFLGDPVIIGETPPT